MLPSSGRFAVGFKGTKVFDRAEVAAGGIRGTGLLVVEVGTDGGIKV